MSSNYYVILKKKLYELLTITLIVQGTNILKQYISYKNIQYSIKNYFIFYDFGHQIYSMSIIYLICLIFH